MCNNVTIPGLPGWFHPTSVRLTGGCLAHTPHARPPPSACVCQTCMQWRRYGGSDIKYHGMWCFQISIWSETSISQPLQRDQITSTYLDPKSYCKGMDQVISALIDTHFIHFVHQSSLWFTFLHPSADWTHSYIRVVVNALMHYQCSHHIEI